MLPVFFAMLVTPLMPIASVEIPWDTATLTLDDAGRAFALTDSRNGRDYAIAGDPFCILESTEGFHAPVSAEYTNGVLTLGLKDGIEVRVRVAPGHGHAWFEVEGITGIPVEDVVSLRIGSLRLRDMPSVAPNCGACFGDNFAIAVMGTHVNAQSNVIASGMRAGTNEGVSASFAPATDAPPQGGSCGVFRATSERDDGSGWAVRYGDLPAPLDLTGLRAVKAHVRGDGKGEQLKIQLYDGKGGYRDDYIPIDFVGWREVTCESPGLEGADLSAIRTLNLYYNGLPPQEAVECAVDDIRAVIERPEGLVEVPLEDFEKASCVFFDQEGVTLSVATTNAHGVLPAGFGVVAAPREEFIPAVEAFEMASGLPSPHPGGVWSKLSPLTKESYLFITSMHESDVDEVIRWAHRGGFTTVLIGENWSRSHGHHEVNTDYFPDGLESLRRATQKLKDAGLRVGLHLLGAGVYLNDPYVTPVPDRRLVEDAQTALAASVDEAATFIETPAPPAGFPAEDGGYMGDGAFLRIGDELVQYSQLSLTPPYGFDGCVRGALGTVASSHPVGDPVSHLLRSYGYFLYDLDSTLAEEVIGNVCKVANAIGADMLYFDGSERLQGDHWYYNAKLQSMYYERLDDRDTFLQGSSYSSYSWHLISRMASADGHGDVKGYLDERIPVFASYAANLMPLDMGWYYVYGDDVTADQFEYILQRCIGFDSSVSVQTNPERLRTHPEAGRIFDMVAAYDRVRLAGGIAEEDLAKLREPGREYRYIDAPPRLRRVRYGPWRDIASLADPANTWEEAPIAPGSRLGLDIRCGALTGPGPAYRAEDAVALVNFEDLAEFSVAEPGQEPVLTVSDDARGGTSPGVTQSLSAVEGGGPEGLRCAKYTATSALAGPEGWSAIGKHFDPPLDLSSHVAIGFWLCGDGGGGAFKLQLRDATGATDYYIQNDFAQWRYIQLPRPTGLQAMPVDYSRITDLMFYYNGLPGNTTLACLIDDVKALQAVDTAEVRGPGLRLGDTIVHIPVTLSEGDRLLWIPGEAPEVTRNKAGVHEALPPVEGIALTGAAQVSFTSEEPLSARIQVRIVEDVPEEIGLP